MKRHDCEQGSAAWMALRASIPTASEFSNLVTPRFAIRTGEMPRTYLASKVAEAWLGGPLPGFSSWATEQGEMREIEAVNWYNFEHNATIDRVGFCTTDDGKVGCSPDGLLGDDCGIEIKCPEPHTHVKYLLNGVLPDDYVAQVHGSMLVTGRSSWRFLSYRRGFPPLVLTVERDEEKMDQLKEALTAFLEQFDLAMQSMIEKNGGPPPPRPEAQLNTRKMRFSVDMMGESDDLIP